MGIKERISNVWQKLKNRFSGQDESEEAVDPSQALEEALPKELPEAENCSAEPASRSAEVPEAGETLVAEVPSRMTDEYKEWLQQQREAADAANNSEQVQ